MKLIEYISSCDRGMRTTIKYNNRKIFSGRLTDYKFIPPQFYENDIVEIIVKIKNWNNFN